jgi:hypothetical protein
MLPWTPMSPPGWCLRSRTNSTSRPSTTVELAHSWSSGVDVATYFSTPLMNVENGSIWLLGQNCAHSLWLRRPRMTASSVAISSGI